jgi:flagellar biosynthesis GTPase FlhF
MKMHGILRGFFLTAIIISGIGIFSVSIAAQVNQSELENLGTVVFINYEGPYSRIETRAQIRSIGYDLGQVVKNGNERVGAQGRYFVIHSVSESDGFKLDADIFGLGPDVGVDHIRNLRTIIQGYLEAAYDYSERDAALLSEYVTVYNAVYRGDWDYFSSRYKNPVMPNLAREKAGLSIRYDEWPGQTLLLIPLGSGSGGLLSSIDTSSISDARVIEQLRQEPDMSLDQRKDMVDLLEREADQASQQAAIVREAIQQEEQRIAQERQQAQQQQQQAQQQQQQIAQERQQAGADQQALDERQRAAEEQQRQAQQQQEELERRLEALEEQRREAESQEAFSEQKSEEAQEQRQQIAQDQQSIISQQPQTQESGVLGVAIINNDTALGRLVILDNSGMVTRQSPLNTVNARTVTLVNGRIFAIAGENRSGGAIRFVEINAATLAMQKQGEDDIAPQSLLWINGQDFYAITVSGANLYLGRFNSDLTLQSRSTVSVHPFASVLFSGGFILTQRDDGSALLLNPVDLNERR